MRDLGRAGDADVRCSPPSSAWRTRSAEPLLGRRGGPRRGRPKRVTLRLSTRDDPAIELWAARQRAGCSRRSSGGGRLRVGKS